MLVEIKSHLQSASAENHSYANLAPHRHLQPPDEKNWNAQHSDVAQEVEYSGGKIQFLYIKTSSWKLRRPYL